jgi:hypothetical protein
MRDAADAALFPQAPPQGATLLRRFALPALRLGPPALMSVLLSGCDVSAGAPSLALFGAYFPSWLACALAGILGAVLVRLVFIPLGLDDMLPVRLPVYVAIAAAIGFLVSLLGFGR